MPKRIQRKRIPGWRLQPNARCVDRTTRFGNPYRVGLKVGKWFDWHESRIYCPANLSATDAVNMFRSLMEQPGIVVESFKALVRMRLRGYDLACWCDDGPCHADVLLEIANQ